MRDYYSILGFAVVNVLAAWVNFGDFVTGTKPVPAVCILMSALVLLYWLGYLIINRNSRGYLRWSLFITVALLVTLGLMLAGNAVALPNMLESLLIVLAILLLPPVSGINALPWPWMLPVCIGVLLVWGGVQVYFLCRIGRKEKP